MHMGKLRKEPKLAKTKTTTSDGGFNPSDTTGSILDQAGLKKTPCRWCGKPYRQPIKHEPYCSENPDNKKPEPGAPGEPEPGPDNSRLEMGPDVEAQAGPVIDLPDMLGATLAELGGNLVGMAAARFVWKGEKGKKWKVPKSWIDQAGPYHSRVLTRLLPEETLSENQDLIGLAFLYLGLFLANGITPASLTEATEKAEDVAKAA